MQVLTHAVEDDNRGVDRVAEDGQHRRDEVAVNRQAENHEHADHDKHIVHEAGDRRQARGQLEADGDIQQHQDNRDRRRHDGRALKVAAYRGADVLVAVEVVLGQVKGLVHLFNDGGAGLGIDRGRADGDLFSGVADRRDRAVYAGDLLKEARDLALNFAGDRLFEVKFHLRAADKVDGEVKQVQAEGQPQQGY